jgi:hypothetical protein
MTPSRPTQSLPLVLLLALALAEPMAARAAVYCVDDASELQLSLEAAFANDENDLIRIEAGIYRSTSPDGFVAFNFSSVSRDLEISGGWTPGCGLRLPGLRSTIDGELARPGMTLGGTTDVRGQLTIRNLQFLRGYSAEANRAGGLTINRGYDVVVESNLFRQNILEFGNTLAGAGLYVLSEGTIAVRGNLFVDNEAPFPSNTAAGAASLGCYSFTGSASFNNNTVTANLADVGGSADFGGVQLIGVPNCPWTVANNILWDNTGLDLAIGVAGVGVRNNDIENLGGSQPPAASSGNLAVDPQFVSAGNQRLRRSSPLVDAGINGASGGLPAASFDGGPRVVATLVDIGAYELDQLLVAGFDPSGFGL